MPSARKFYMQLFCKHYGVLCVCSGGTGRISRREAPDSQPHVKICNPQSTCEDNQEAVEGTMYILNTAASFSQVECV